MSIDIVLLNNLMERSDHPAWILELAMRFPQPVSYGEKCGI
jgi:hypothetical protein